MELIDRNALKEHAYMEHIPGYDYLVVEWSDIEDAPTVDAVPVVRGKWVITRPADSDGPACYKCSECEIKVGCKASNYCPDCGAKMEAGE